MADLGDMTVNVGMDTRSLALFIEVQELITRRERFLVENRVCEAMGQRPGYVRDSFVEIEQGLWAVYDKAVELQAAMEVERERAAE
jgi:hypothetical protein